MFCVESSFENDSATSLISHCLNLSIAMKQLHRLTHYNTLQYRDQGERVIVVFPMQYRLIGKASDKRVVIFTFCKGISCDYDTAESSLKFSEKF